MRFLTLHGSLLAISLSFSHASSPSDGNTNFVGTRTAGCSNYQPDPQISGSQPPSGGNWLGFGGNIYNNHRAGSDAVVNIANVDTLQTVCQRKYNNGGISAAPLVEDGVAYYNTFSGLLVALNYEACKEKWTINITDLILKADNSTPIAGDAGPLASRNTPVVDGDILYFGTLARALIVAVDKSTGKVIDTLAIGSGSSSQLTQSPTLYNHRLFIGVSTTESSVPSEDPTYKLTHQGAMHAIELRNGRLRLIWTTHMIPPGANFTGASIWGSQPSIDKTRNQVFIGTGQLHSLPDAFVECQIANENLRVQTEHLANEPCLPRNVYQTSVLALDMDTGEINWYRTLGALDAWVSACVPFLHGKPPSDPPGPNCPKNAGNDTDFGMAPAFVPGSAYTPGKKDVVVAGQKSGNIYAFSAQTGSVLWANNVVPGGIDGGMSWGVAVDEQTVYYTGINSNRESFTLSSSNKTISNSVFGAVSLRDGRIKWQTAAPRNMTSRVAPNVVNDLVLTGVSGDWKEGIFDPQGPGAFIAFNKFTGEIVKETKLDAYFHGFIASVKEYVMFGTGYYPPLGGSFNVLRIGTANSTGAV